MRNTTNSMLPHEQIHRQGQWVNIWKKLINLDTYSHYDIVFTTHDRKHLAKWDIMDGPRNHVVDLDSRRRRVILIYASRTGHHHTSSSRHVTCGLFAATAEQTSWQIVFITSARMLLYAVKYCISCEPIGGAISCKSRAAPQISKRKFRWPGFRRLRVRWPSGKLQWLLRHSVWFLYLSTLGLTLNLIYFTSFKVTTCCMIHVHGFLPLNTFAVLKRVVLIKEEFVPAHACIGSKSRSGDESRIREHFIRSGRVFCVHHTQPFHSKHCPR